jgi:hypothetical protein
LIGNCLREAAIPPTAFGESLREDLKDRQDHLFDQGIARRSGARVLYAADLLGTLRNRELTEVAGRLEESIQLPCRPTADGVRVSGVYRESLQLTSGRYAVPDDGCGFRCCLGGQ